MEELEEKITHALNKWYRKSRMAYVLACFVGLAIILVIAYLLVSALIHPESNKLWKDIVVNIIATIIGILIAYLIVRILFLFGHNNEDKHKVSYANSDMWKQYNMHYLQQFTMHNKPNVFAVYCEKLFRMADYKHVEVDDYPDEFFELDSFIKSQFFKLIEAHAMSDSTNSITVRLKEVVFPEEKDTVVIRTMRSTYLSHLLTNRALDYELKPEITIRSLFENTDTLIPPQRSRMSNHFGVNALVFLKETEESSEPYWLLIPERDRRATVAKGKVTASIATRIQMDKFEHKYTDKLTSEYLTKDCIYDYIEKAIKAKNPPVKSIEFLGLSRDIYEGGKPTLFYTVLLDWTSNQYVEACKSYDNENKKKSKQRAEQNRNGYIPAQKEDIDEVAIIHIAEWNTVTIGKVAPIKIENDLTYYNSKYDKALLEFKTDKGKMEHKAFEQNLIANFWFWRGCPT